MFSLDNFYNVLYSNLLEQRKMSMFYFLQFRADFQIQDLYFNHSVLGNTDHNVLFHDQEPLFEKFIDQIKTSFDLQQFPYLTNSILANSEHSAEKDLICKKYNLTDWYYFFHGFAALEWFRDYKYFPKFENQPTRLFITFNNLVTKERSYRLNLVARLKEQELLDQGYVSCRLDSWRQELIDPQCLLSVPSKKLIYQQFNSLNDNLVIDSASVDGTFSSKFDPAVQTSGLWHLVTETVFYHNKLHLTEKIFKPIVARRPFILVAAPGNLAYLKSYGFRTFDRWIDESYDQIQDPDLRLQHIVAQLAKFSPADIPELLTDMQSVLDYNYQHFYGDFKRVLVEELVNNFQQCLTKLDIDYDPYSLARTKNFLLR